MVFFMSFNFKRPDSIKRYCLCYCYRFKCYCFFIYCFLRYSVHFFGFPFLYYSVSSFKRNIMRVKAQQFFRWSRKKWMKTVLTRETWRTTSRRKLFGPTIGWFNAGAVARTNNFTGNKLRSYLTCCFIFCSTLFFKYFLMKWDLFFTWSERGEGESLRPGYFLERFFYGLAELSYINFRARHIHVYLRFSFQHSVVFNISEISQLFTNVSKMSPIGNVAIVKPFACVLPKARRK